MSKFSKNDKGEQLKVNVKQLEDLQKEFNSLLKTIKEKLYE